MFHSSFPFRFRFELKRCIQLITAAVAIFVSRAASAEPASSEGALRSAFDNRRLYTAIPCTTGPVPQQIHSETIAVYFHLGWAAVPGATSYAITRQSGSDPPTTITPPGFNPAPAPILLEYWDVPPDTSRTYQYTIYAYQPNFCYGTATVTSGVFSTPNPDLYQAVRTTATTGKLIWRRMLGATSYRVDGPGFPAGGQILRADTYVPGQMPGLVGSTIDVQTSGTDVWIPVSNLPTAQSQWRVVAIYPGPAADYAHPSTITLPALLPCSISQISPISGPKNTTVVQITGRDFNFVQNVWSRLPAGDFPISRNVISPTTITALPSGTGPIVIDTAGGRCVSAQVFTATTVTLPSQVTVPQVVGDSLAAAGADLQRAGLTLRSVSGSTSPNAVVVSQNPQAGARVASGSNVDVATVASVSGVSTVTVYNNTSDGDSVYVWLWNPVTGHFDAQNNAALLAPGQSTDVDLMSAQGYIIYAIDPLWCGANDPYDNSCWRWQQSVIGDPNGYAYPIPLIIN